MSTYRTTTPTIRAATELADSHLKIASGQLRRGTRAADQVTTARLSLSEQRYLAAARQAGWALSHLADSRHGVTMDHIVTAIMLLGVARVESQGIETL